MTSRFLKVLAASSVLLAFAMGNVSAQMAAGPHDLNTHTTPASMPTGWTGGTDLCRFCHTPHNAEVLVPLWDRTGPDTTTWTVYSSASMDDTMPDPSGVSAGCLSCHDGVTAFDAIAGGTGASTGNNMVTDYAGSAAIIGSNLSNDHPVGVDVTVDDDMELPTAITGAGVPLFTDGSNDVLVECASCHDAHETVNAYFLRLDPADGDLCETCHTK